MEASAPPAQDVPRRERRFEWWFVPAAIVLALLLASLLQGVVFGIASATGADVSDSDDLPPAVTIIATILQNAAFVATALVFASLAGRARPDVFGLVRTPLVRAVGLAALTFVAFLVFAAVWSTVIGSDAREDAPERLGADEGALALAGVLVLVAVVVPVGEELFFRGFVFGVLRERTGLWLAALVSGLLFGGAHALGSPVEFLVPLAFLGVAFCLLYAQTGSLLPSIGLHALNNGLATGVSLDWAGWQTALAALLAPCAAVGLALAVAGAWRRIAA